MILFKSVTRIKAELKICELERENVRLKESQRVIKLSLNPTLYFKIDREISHNFIRINALKSIL